MSKNNKLQILLCQQKNFSSKIMFSSLKQTKMEILSWTRFFTLKLRLHYLRLTLNGQDKTHVKCSKKNSVNNLSFYQDWFFFFFFVDLFQNSSEGIMSIYRFFPRTTRVERTKLSPDGRAKIFIPEEIVRSHINLYANFYTLSVYSVETFNSRSR